MCTLPGVDRVVVRRDVEYRAADGGALAMDLYYPPDSTDAARTPAVIFVTGFTDAGAQRMLGCRLKELGSLSRPETSTPSSSTSGATAQP